MPISPRSAICRLLAAMALTLVASGCSDDSGPDRPAMVTDIVVLKSQAAHSSEFEAYPPGSGTPYVLRADRAVVNLKDCPVGSRLLLSYFPEEAAKPYQSGNIEIRYCVQINNDALRVVDDESGLDGWDADPIYLYSAWRMGPYLNFRLGLTYDPSPRVFHLVMAKAEASEDCPTLYLAHRRGGESPAPNFLRTYYASFDISALMQTPGVEAVDVRLNNSNLTSLTALHFPLNN